MAQEAELKTTVAKDLVSNPGWSKAFPLVCHFYKSGSKICSDQRQVISVVILGSGSQQFDLLRDLLSWKTVVARLGPEITRSTYPN